MEKTADELYQLLLDSLNEREGFDPGTPVTVAEIYQELIPYREVRERLGLTLNADYEHALLILLAGVGDRLQLEPSSARAEIRKELESSNPYLGIYRKFAACDVHLSAEALATIHLTDGAGDGSVGVVTTRYEPEEAPASTTPAPAPTTGPESCPFCSRPTPVGRAARFCPFCGKDLSTKPCVECEEVLEADWLYCITCGTPVPLG